MHAGAAHQRVEAVGGQRDLVERGQVAGQGVGHQRRAVHRPRAAAAGGAATGVAGVSASASATSSSHGDGLEREDPRRGLLTRAGEVVVQAGQFERPTDRRHHHLRADTALADQQALVHQVGDRLPQRRAGQLEIVGEVEFVRDPVTRGEPTAGDRLLDLPGDLEVQRHRAATVDVQFVDGIEGSGRRRRRSSPRPVRKRVVAPVRSLRRHDGTLVATERTQRHT